MHIWYLSDLHLEERDYDLEIVGWCPPHASVLVLAGDVGNGAAGVQWANRQAEVLGLPVIFVPGNHDFFDVYGTDLQALLGRMKTAAAPGVHVLYNERIEIRGVTFLGATLWTDFAYSEHAWTSEQDLMRAASTFPDFSLINVEGDLLTPETWVRLHQEARDWLESELISLQDRDAGPRVVVTHHLPHPRSLDPRHRGSDTDAAFCSRLPDALLGLADAWIHGHSHHAQDWRGPGGVHVVSNPLGYPGEGRAPGFERPQWVTV